MSANITKGLFYINLQGADLTNANLSGIRLGRANFRHAIFEGANLQDADLTDAENLEPSQLQQAINWHLAHYSETLKHQLELHAKRSQPRQC